MSRNLLGGTPPAAPLPPQKLADRECGDCALCCKLLPIPGFKEAGPWCQYCSSHKGCDNYENRPTPCRTFFCSYMVDPALNRQWHPTRAHLFLSLNAGDGARPQMRVIVDTDHPDAWRKEPYFTNFKHWSAQYYVIVTIGKRRIVIFPDHEKDLGILAEGETVEMVQIQTPAGVSTTAQVRKKPH